MVCFGTLSTSASTPSVLGHVGTTATQNVRQHSVAHHSVAQSPMHVEVHAFAYGPQLKTLQSHLLYTIV